LPSFTKIFLHNTKPKKKKTTMNPPATTTAAASQVLVCFACLLACLQIAGIFCFWSQSLLNKF
jgi:hypothetical protein